jgi:hypothetical protein
MSPNDLHNCFVERNIQQIGCFSGKRYDVGSHSFRLGVDINSNDPRVWHSHDCTDGQASLRADAAGTVYYSSWCESSMLQYGHPR